VNGDGIDDLIMGAWAADPNGVSGAGTSYVVFGRASGFDSVISLGSLESLDGFGFRIEGVAQDDNSILLLP
jgi:hypothetical protein